MKILADMHDAPALRRWAVGLVLRRDPRAVKLEQQLEELRAHARELAAGNAAMARDVEALQSDVRAVEDRARADLGMVYPDEVVFEVRPKGWRSGGAPRGER